MWGCRIEQSRRAQPHGTKAHGAPARAWVHGAERVGAHLSAAEHADPTGV